MIKFLCIALLAPLFLSGCATTSMFGIGQPQDCNILSRPSAVIYCSTLTENYGDGFFTALGPKEPKYVYDLEDKQVVWWADVSTVKALNLGAVKVEWISPDGKVFKTDERIPFTRAYIVSVLPIKGHIDSSLEGEWKVRVYSEGVFCEEKRFVIGAVDAGTLELPDLDEAAKEYLEIDKAGAVILFDNTSILLEKDGSYKVNYHRRLKILKESGKEAAEVVIPFYQGLERFKINSAYTITPAGKAVVATEYTTKSFYPGYPSYRGMAYIMMAMPAIETGSIIEYDIDVYFFSPTIKGRFLFEKLFPFYYPAMSADIRLSYPKRQGADNVNVKMYNVDAEPVIEETTSDVQYAWRLSNQKALEREPKAPPLRGLCPELVVTDYKSWDDLAPWLKDNFSEILTPNEDMKKITAEVTAGAADKEGCARRIYRYVQDNIRYVGVDFGRTPYKPQKIEEILKNKYGDCKDSVVLLAAMLKGAGIESHPVLVRTKMCGNAYMDMPTPYEFDHAINLVKIGGKDIWLDATDKNAAFGVLPIGDQAVDALLLLQDGPEFVKTPASGPKDNKFSGENNIQINQDFGIKGDFIFKASGAIAAEYRDIIRNIKEDEKEKYVRNLMNNIFSPAEILDYKFPRLEDFESDFTIEISYTAKDQLAKIENLVAFAPMARLHSAFFEMTDKERAYDIFMPFAYLREDKVIVTVPDFYSLKALPENFSTGSIAGSASLEFQRNGSQVALNFKENITAGRIKPEDYDKIKKYRDDIARELKQQIIFTERLG